MATTGPLTLADRIVDQYIERDFSVNEHQQWERQVPLRFVPNIEHSVRCERSLDIEAHIVALIGQAS